MKQTILIFAFTLLSSLAWSQENRFTISYGYSFANIDNIDSQADGWRLNGLYELNPQEGNISHGIAFGYTSISASEINNSIEQKSTVSSIPVYYVPKIMFGEGKAKPFIKGALGFQFAKLEREGVLAVTANDFGFFGGGGAGILIDVNEKVFLNAEYEIAYVSNSLYDDGWLNSAMIGLGIKF